MTGTTTSTCPSCGTPRLPGASFCEACAYDFSTASAGGVVAEGAPETTTPPATPATAPAGEESPLDVGWTGRTVVGEAGTPQSAGADGEPEAAAP